MTPLQSQSPHKLPFPGGFDTLLIAGNMGALGISIAALIISTIALSQSRRTKNTLINLIQRKRLRPIPFARESKDGRAATSNTPLPPQSNPQYNNPWLETQKPQPPHNDEVTPLTMQKTTLHAPTAIGETLETDHKHNKLATPEVKLESNYEPTIKNLVLAFNTGNNQLLRDRKSVV